MTPTQQFAQDLRRILYLNKILSFELDNARRSPCCISLLKMDFNNMQNSINRLTKSIMVKVKPEQWEILKADLNKDELHDVSLLIEFCCGRDGVGELLGVLEEHVKEGGENNNETLS